MFSPMDSALTGEPVIVNAAENENGETYDANVADATNERNTMPATLDEFQSHWIGIYLPSLYLSSVRLFSNCYYDEQPETNVL